MTEQPESIFPEGPEGPPTTTSGWRVRLENRQAQMTRLIALEAPDVLLARQARMIRETEASMARSLPDTFSATLTWPSPEQMGEFIALVAAVKAERGGQLLISREESARIFELLDVAEVEGHG